MAQIKISELNAVSSVSDSDVLPIVNSGDTKKITMAQLKTAIGTPDLSDYVKNTDYATDSTGGTVKISGTYAIGLINNNGRIFADVKTYSQYDSLTTYGFISKGTLENVITGKQLTDKNYVDNAIATAITTTLGGSY